MDDHLFDLGFQTGLLLFVRALAPVYNLFFMGAARFSTAQAVDVVQLVIRMKLLALDAFTVKLCQGVSLCLLLLVVGGACGLHDGVGLVVLCRNSIDVVLTGRCQVVGVVAVKKNLAFNLVVLGLRIGGTTHKGLALETRLSAFGGRGYDLLLYVPVPVFVAVSVRLLMTHVNDLLLN